MPGRLGSESSVPSELPQLAHTGAGLLSFPGRRKEQRGRERGLSLANTMSSPFLSLTQLRNRAVIWLLLLPPCLAAPTGLGTAQADGVS